VYPELLAVPVPLLCSLVAFVVQRRLGVCTVVVSVRCGGMVLAPREVLCGWPVVWWSCPLFVALVGSRLRGAVSVSVARILLLGVGGPCVGELPATLALCLVAPPVRWAVCLRCVSGARLGGVPCGVLGVCVCVLLGVSCVICPLGGVLCGVAAVVVCRCAFLGTR